MPFEVLSPLAVVLKSFTLRTEKHGDDDVTAVSIGLKTTQPNTFLDALDPRLRGALYMAVPDQDVLPGVEPSTPLLRTTSITGLDLKQCFEGWTLEIDHGIGDPIKLGDAKVDRFHLQPKEGGSVELSFRVGSNDIDATEIGLIGAKLAQEISIRLMAPEVKADKPVIDGSTAAFEADTRDAGDIFAEQNSPEIDGPVTSDDAPPDDDDADSEGGEIDQGVADFEAGLTKQIEGAGLKPKRRGPAANGGRRAA